MGTSSSEKDRGEMKERTNSNSGCVDYGPNKAVAVEGGMTHRRRVEMSANTQGKKPKENALLIGRDLLD
jgi:hypothetical protein